MAPALKPSVPTTFQVTPSHRRTAVFCPFAISRYATIGCPFQIVRELLRANPALKPSVPTTFQVVPVQFRFRDPVLGERYQPLAVVPPALVNLAENVQIFAGSRAQDVRLKVIAGAAGVVVSMASRPLPPAAT